MPNPKIEPVAAAPEGTPFLPVPANFISTMSIWDFVKSTFGGAVVLSGVVYFEYGMIFSDESKAVSDKFVDDWLWTVFLISGAVAFVVSMFGWALWVRAVNWMAAKMGSANFNRTKILRQAGVLVLVGVIGLGILLSVRLLARLGY